VSARGGDGGDVGHSTVIEKEEHNNRKGVGKKGSMGMVGSYG